MLDGNLLFLLKCPNYNTYLDHFVKIKDEYYIRNVVVNRTLVTLGYRTTHEPYSPEQFRKLKAQVFESLFPPKTMSAPFSYCITSTDPVLKALSHRELPNKQKILSTIIFLSFRSKQGFEISGFVDYEQSLRHASLRYDDATDWDGVFKERVLFRPNKSDLSYYDWHRNVVFCKDSDNYTVQYDTEHGLLFMHRGDHKKISVNINNKLCSQNVQYSTTFSKKYGHVIFFDHIVRKKI